MNESYAKLENMAVTFECPFCHCTFKNDVWPDTDMWIKENLRGQLMIMIGVYCSKCGLSSEIELRNIDVYR